MPLLDKAMLQRPAKSAAAGDEEMDLDSLLAEDEELGEEEDLEEGEYAFTEDEAVEMLEARGWSLTPPEGAEELGEEEEL